jgi:predicted MFS family arabinose efflux permease
MPLIGKLSDKIDKSKLFYIGSALAIVVMIVYTHLPQVPLWVAIIANILLFAGVMSRMVPAGVLNTAVPDKKDTGAYLSFCSSMQQMSGGIGALIAGFIIFQPTTGSPIEQFDTMGYVFVGTAVVSMFLVARVNKIVGRKAD